MIKPSSKIFIQKAPKKKDAVRINSAEDIPEFLRNTISIDGDEMVMHNAEGGEQRAPLGMVCGFEKSEKTSSGYGMWPISDESRIIEKDGVFYAKPQVTPACPMGVEIPDWLEGAPIKKNHDDSFTITTSWGKSTGNMMDSYWVRYGTKEDGTPDANILTKSEPSFDDYYLCTEDGQNICPLRKFDEGFEYELDSNLRLTPEEYAAQLADEYGIQQGNKNVQSSRAQRADEIISSSGDYGFSDDQLS